MFRGFRISPAQDERPVCVLRLRRPDLLPVDAKIVPLFDRFGLQRREIGSRVRLGISLTPDFFAINDLRDESLLLLVGPPLHQRRPDQRRSRSDKGQGSVRPLQLLVIDDRPEDTQTASAEFLRPIDAGPAARGELAKPSELAPPVFVILFEHASEVLQRLARRVLLQPGSKLLPKRLILVAVIEIQSRSPKTIGREFKLT